MKKVKKSLNAALSLLQSPFRKEYSLYYLNATQFSVVLIDNIFKLIIAYFLIDRMGKQNASLILFFVGAIYVIPFLLFSSVGGLLADRFSKNRVTIAIKIFEVVIIIIALAVFHYESIIGAYSILFLLSAQSALFGPSKYGILPELLPKNEIAKGNAIITSSTYLAIIVGTFLASFLTDFTNHEYVIIGLITLIFSILGLISAFKIRYTKPVGPSRKINSHFFSQVRQALLYTKTKRHLTLSIGSASFFLFIGAFIQLNIIPYAISVMNLSEVAGGYLFLITAMGIALGSIISGKICKNEVRFTLPLAAGFLLGLFLILLKFTGHSLIVTSFALVGLGLAGGVFIVPFDVYTQVSSDDQHRGQVIGASNFFQFVGVLIASLALFLFSSVFSVSSSTGFFCIGILSLLYSLFFLFKISEYTAPLISKCLHPLAHIEISNPGFLKNEKGILCVTKPTQFSELLLLSRFSDKLFILAPKGTLNIPPFLENNLGCIISCDSEISPEELLTKAKTLLSKGVLCCLILDNPFSLPEKKRSFFNLFKSKSEIVPYLEIEQLAKNHFRINLSTEIV